MASQAYAGSPIAALSEALGGRLEPGQVGIIAARAGVGKSAMVVHISLDALLRDHSVMHVAIGDTVEHARAHYDHVFRAVAQSGHVQDWTSALVAAERHRMIHSYLLKDYTTVALRSNLSMLAEVAHFQPTLIVFDGLDNKSLKEHLPAIAEVARDLNVPVWIAVRSASGRIPDETWDYASLSLRLTPDGRQIHLSLHRSAEDSEPLSMKLDATSMLVRAEGSTAGEGAPGAARAADCTLYSGGASGSESAFGEAAERHGVHEVNFTFEGHRQDRDRGSYTLSPRELAAGDVSLVYVSRRLNRTYNTEGGLIRRVLQTLWHMVSRSQQVFVIGQIQDDGTVVGGTGWSVELARMWSKDLWVYDQTKRGWYQWTGEEWSAGLPTINSVHFTGTGTRYLDDHGRDAVFDLFARTYGGQT
jgi:hypothetical protein